MPGISGMQYEPLYLERYVLLHAGDLFFAGYDDGQVRTGQMLKSAQAELRIAIPGNHGITLDKALMIERERETVIAGNVKLTVEKIRALCRSEDAKAHGIIYLGEKGFARSPWETVPNSLAILCLIPSIRGALTGLFDIKKVLTCLTAEALMHSPIPDYVHIVMSHGPPKGIFNPNPSGKRVGCSHLWRAVERVEPRLHCSGHMHETWGTA
ncbi:hypothetical protein KEM54_004415 [Ascosphaera aggregata]|nr:hypothetical protein KEM54_004415 [Ascosphaera aggregata]